MLILELPIMYPNPNDTPVQDITVDTLPGYITMRIGRTEVNNAASATPSRNLKQKNHIFIKSSIQR